MTGITKNKVKTILIRRLVLLLLRGSRRKSTLLARRVPLHNCPLQSAIRKILQEKSSSSAPTRNWASTTYPSSSTLPKEIYLANLLIPTLSDRPRSWERTLVVTKANVDRLAPMVEEMTKHIPSIDDNDLIEHLRGVVRPLMR